MPWAAFPRRFAVAGARTIRSARSVTSMCSTFAHSSRSHWLVRTGRPVSEANVRGPTSCVAPRVMTTVTSCSALTRREQRSAAL